MFNKDRKNINVPKRMLAWSATSAARGDIAKGVSWGGNVVQVKKNQCVSSRRDKVEKVRPPQSRSSAVRRDPKFLWTLSDEDEWVLAV